MPGFAFRHCLRLAPPNIARQLLGANLDGSATAKPFIYPGDPVVWTQNSTYRTSADPGSNPINLLRPLLQADATALYGSAAVAVPAAPTGSAVTAASFGIPFLANGNYQAVVTAVDAFGETTQSPNTANITTAGGTQALQINPPAALPAGAVAFKVYVSAVGTTTPLFYQGTIGAGQVLFVGGTAAANALDVTGPNPPTGNTTGGRAGILGFAAYSARTDANALNSAPIIGAGVASNVPAIYSMPGVAASYPASVDPQTSTIIHATMGVIMADAFNVFRGILGGSGDTVPKVQHIGKQAGIVVSASSSPNVQNTYKIDTSLNTLALGACLQIVGIDTEDPLNNAVLFQVLSQFQQINAGNGAYTAN